MTCSNIYVYSYPRYNGIISRVKKRRIKRSGMDNLKKERTKKKHRGRRKRQDTETVIYDLGKRTHILKYWLLSLIRNGRLCIFVLTNYFVFLELVIQRRSASKSYDTCDSSPCRDTYFDKGWSEYKSGFGSLSNDYWIGLEQLYNLTNTQGQTWGLEVIKPKQEIWYLYKNKKIFSLSAHKIFSKKCI